MLVKKVFEDFGLRNGVFNLENVNFNVVLNCCEIYELLASSNSSLVSVDNSSNAQNCFYDEKKFFFREDFFTPYENPRSVNKEVLKRKYKKAISLKNFTKVINSFVLINDDTPYDESFFSNLLLLSKSCFNRLVFCVDPVYSLHIFFEDADKPLNCFNEYALGLKRTSTYVDSILIVPVYGMKLEALCFGLGLSMPDNCSRIYNQILSRRVFDEGFFDLSEDFRNLSLENLDYVKERGILSLNDYKFRQVKNKKQIISESEGEFSIRYKLEKYTII